MLRAELADRKGFEKTAGLLGRGLSEAPVFEDPSDGCEVFIRGVNQEKRAFGVESRAQPVGEPREEGMPVARREGVVGDARGRARVKRRIRDHQVEERTGREVVPHIRFENAHSIRKGVPLRVGPGAFDRDSADVRGQDTGASARGDKGEEAGAGSEIDDRTAVEVQMAQSLGQDPARREVCRVQDARRDHEVKACETAFVGPMEARPDPKAPDQEGGAAGGFDQGLHRGTKDFSPEARATS